MLTRSKREPELDVAIGTRMRAAWLVTRLHGPSDACFVDHRTAVLGSARARTTDKVANRPMITGRQIREARVLLGLQRNELAAMTKAVTTATIVRAEAVDGEAPITCAQSDAIRQALDRAGIALTVDGGTPKASDRA